MTGTQSLSVRQFDAIAREIDKANDDPNFDPSMGEVVSVVIHQADPGWLLDGHFDTSADKRVQLHRAYTDPVVFWMHRDGTIAPSAHRKP